MMRWVRTGREREDVVRRSGEYFVIEKQRMEINTRSGKTRWVGTGEYRMVRTADQMQVAQWVDW